jgi:hypothetical protein
MSMRDEWERLEALRERMYEAKTLPERFEAVLTYQGELYGFVHDNRRELDRLINDKPVPRPRLVTVPKDRAA